MSAPDSAMAMLDALRCIAAGQWDCGCVPICRCTAEVRLESYQEMASDALETVKGAVPSAANVVDQLDEHEKQRLRDEIQRLKERCADLNNRNHGLLSALQTAESDRKQLRDALEQERNGKRPPRLPDGVRPALRVVSGGES